MTNIKTKKIFIKELNKSKVLKSKIRNPILSLNNRTKQEYESPNDYGENKINQITNKIQNQSRNEINKINKNIINWSNNRINDIKERRSIKNLKKATIKMKGVAKAKTLEQTKKMAIESAKKTPKRTKRVIKEIIEVIKKTIEVTEYLISLIIAGGFVSVIIIILICLIALIYTSSFGIFLANDKDEQNLNSAIAEINKNFHDTIEIKRKETNSDQIELINYINNWKDILIIYSAKYSVESLVEPIFNFSNENKENLKQIFWDMNNISYDEKIEIEDETSIKVLYITTTTKSIDEMILYYNFNSNQISQVRELSDSKYDAMWQNLLNNFSNNIVTVALKELGNRGGEKYWRWYGFDNRVEWCAIFVSWVAYESNTLNVTIPKFSIVGDGIRWYKKRGQFKGVGYIPKAGDIIFFDWENDGKANHVGIVEKVENNKIYTIEGNSNDRCKQRDYPINSNVIYGFGSL